MEKTNIQYTYKNDSYFKLFIAAFFGNTFLYFFLIAALKITLLSLPIFILFNYFLLKDIKQLTVLSDGSIIVKYLFRSDTINFRDIKNIKLNHTNSRLGITTFLINSTEKKYIFELPDSKIKDALTIFLFYKTRYVQIIINSSLTIHKVFGEVEKNAVSLNNINTI